MNILTQIGLPLALAFIMFSMGLTLVFDDFRRISKFPKAFFWGLFLQIVTLPALAFILASLWSQMDFITPELAVGIIIIAACPGGVTSNLMTHLGKGDTALSITLTAVISILSVITVPLVINLGYSVFIGLENSSPLPVGRTVLGIFCITTIPVMIGMLVRSKKTEFALKFEPVARKMASSFFVVIILAAIVKSWGLIVDSIASIGPVILLLNLSAMAISILATKLVKLNKSQSIAIAFECGLQNGTLAIMIAATFLKNETMIIPAGIYSIFMFITGAAYLLFLNRKS